VFIFLILKFIQEVFYNFKCPFAILLYGELVRNHDPRYLAYKAERERIKKKTFKFVQDPFKNKVERAKQLAKAQEEFEARRAINEELLKQWRSSRRAAKRLRIKNRKKKKKICLI